MTPRADTEGLNAHLTEIARTVAPQALAVLVPDGAGENIWPYLHPNTRTGLLGAARRLRIAMHHSKFDERRPKVVGLLAVARVEPGHLHGFTLQPQKDEDF